jgi:hypothetical protein
VVPITFPTMAMNSHIRMTSLLIYVRRTCCRISFWSMACDCEQTKRATTTCAGIGVWVVRSNPCAVVMVCPGYTDQGYCCPGSLSSGWEAIKWGALDERATWRCQFASIQLVRPGKLWLPREFRPRGYRDGKATFPPRSAEPWKRSQQVSP